MVQWLCPILTDCMKLCFSSCFWGGSFLLIPLTSLRIEKQIFMYHKFPHALKKPKYIPVQILNFKSNEFGICIHPLEILTWLASKVLYICWFPTIALNCSHSAFLPSENPESTWEQDGSDENADWPLSEVPSSWQGPHLMGKKIWTTQVLKERQKVEPLLSALRKAMNEEPTHLDLAITWGQTDLVKTQRNRNWKRESKWHSN